MDLRTVFCCALLCCLAACQAKGETENENQIPGVPSLQVQRGSEQTLGGADTRDYHPKWSNREKKLTFTSVRNQAMGLWVYDSLDTEPRRIALNHPGDLHFSWNPADDRIVFDGRNSENRPIILSFDLQSESVVPFIQAEIRGGQPNWSPDGTMIAFQHFDTLRIFHIESGEVQVTCPGASFPSWSPDSRRIAFGYLDDIWIYDLGRDAAEIHVPGQAVQDQAAWSPDGRTIIYYSNENGSRDIWIIPAAGGDSVQVTDHAGNEWHPAWHPDGNRIAFTQDWNGTLNICVLELNVTIVPAGNSD